MSQTNSVRNSGTFSDRIKTENLSKLFDDQRVKRENQSFVRLAKCSTPKGLKIAVDIIYRLDNYEKR